MVLAPPTVQGTGMDDPIETLLAWYERQAPDIRHELAFHVHVVGGRPLFPTPYSVDEAEGDLVLVFKDRVRELAEPEFASAGLAIMLGALVDFVVMKMRAKHDWARVSDMQDRVIGTLEAEGNARFADLLRESQRRVPLVGRRWMKTIEEWDELRRTSLSPEEIDRWLQAQFVGRFT